MDVLVIGCGASGVAALRRLHDAGLKVLGLEAADRIGGRIHSVEYNGKVLDMGASWCHGERDNIVFEMANPLGLLEKPEPDTKWFVLSNGELIPNEKSQAIMNAFDKMVAESDKYNSKSISECVRSASTCNELDSKLAGPFTEWYERNSHLGGQDDPSHAKSLRGIVEGWGCEGNFLINWKGKGYKTIFDILLNRYPDPSKEVPVQILLNKEVESIKWRKTKPGLDQSNSLVQVTCKDGSLYAAKSVIVTVSVGVLKDRHAQLFNPPLPKEKVNTINTLKLCVVDKIYIEFEKPWWTKSPACFNVVWNKEDKDKFGDDQQWVTELYGLQTVEHHPNLLLAWIYGTGAEKMEKVSSEGIKAGVEKFMTILKKQFNVTPVKNVIRTQWCSNPLIRGTYSHRTVATEEYGGGAIILSEPLYHGDNFPVVCFAGEATSHHRHGAVHGAIEAGFREADRLIESFKRSGN